MKETVPEEIEEKFTLFHIKFRSAWKNAGTEQTKMNTNIKKLYALSLLKANHL